MEHSVLGFKGMNRIWTALSLPLLTLACGSTVVPNESVALVQDGLQRADVPDAGSADAPSDAPCSGPIDCCVQRGEGTRLECAKRLYEERCTGPEYPHQCIPLGYCLDHGGVPMPPDGHCGPADPANPSETYCKTFTTAPECNRFPNCPCGPTPPSPDSCTNPMTPAPPCPPCPPGADQACLDEYSQCEFKRALHNRAYNEAEMRRLRCRAAAIEAENAFRSCVNRNPTTCR
jgi:hypothetical protein